MIGKGVTAGLIAWAVIASGAAGAGWYEAHQAADKTPTTVVKKVTSGSKTTVEKKVKEQADPDAKAAEKELNAQRSDDALLTQRAKDFVTLTTQYYHNAAKQHRQIEAISTKKIADEEVVVPEGGMAQDQNTWGTTWFNRDVQLEPGDGSKRQATVRVVFELAGTGNSSPQKQDNIYRLQFTNGKITSYSLYSWDQVEPGVPLNGQ